MDRRHFLAGTAAFGASTSLLTSRLAAQGKPMKIGIMNDLSGPYAGDQGVGSKIAADMAIQDWASKLGVQVETIIADHQNKPDIGAGIARKWYDTEGVDVIMDLPNSAVALAVVAVAKEKNKAVIGSGAGSSVLTGPMCSKNFVHWTYDTYVLGNSLGKALTGEGAKSWYFITADYAFGKDLESNCANAVVAAGGKVLGAARHPLNTADFSSFLLQAQSSGADVIGFANAGGDLIQSLKQATEFGLKKKMAALILDVTNLPSLGLAAVQNVTVCKGFYWDQNEGTRAFANRYQAAHPQKAKPNDMHAGMYASTLHLMKAFAQTKNATDGVKLIDAMKAIPTDDPMFGKGSIREDGRHIHTMYLLTTKTVAESKGDWDWFKVTGTVKPEDAWRPLAKGGCPFIKA
ncbi:MAG: ABC transporter substrate-binding protein [Rhodoblastus sp.]|nr:ABC transporter substrate-binding protein [Rhodoblastus sp.]MCB9999017.1 ABC transporter substrate-binding protein [Methylobacteriaceae bacterium]MCC0002187.1 ABC transporter substrate-binding protein [Methylobacteriaceae bacterium]MCO5087430.1 ABC transporter substrate-binding protein [Methylobacteriaceae bacterium]